MEDEILTKELPEYLPEFVDALKIQVESDNARWGNTWKVRGLYWNGHSQERRFKDWFNKQWVAYTYEGRPLPWLKIAGEAMIGYIREKYLSRRNNGI